MHSCHLKSFLTLSFRAHSFEENFLSHESFVVLPFLQTHYYIFRVMVISLLRWFWTFVLTILLCPTGGMPSSPCSTPLSAFALIRSSTELLRVSEPLHRFEDCWGEGSHAPCHKFPHTFSSPYSKLSGSSGEVDPPWEFGPLSPVHGPNMPRWPAEFPLRSKIHDYSFTFQTSHLCPKLTHGPDRPSSGWGQLPRGEGVILKTNDS